MIIRFNNLEDISIEKTVYTAGTFDLFHSGHVLYLKKIKEMYPDHKLVVGILSDKRVRVKKGNERPVIKQYDRMLVMDVVRYVDYTFVCPTMIGDATFKILEKLRPEVVVFPQRKYLKQADKFEEIGAKLVIIGKVGKRYSTSQIINKIKTNKS